MFPFNFNHLLFIFKNIISSFKYNDFFISGRGDVRKALLKTWAELGGGMLVFKYVQMYWALEISDTHKDKAVEDCSADLQV